MSADYTPAWYDDVGEMNVDKTNAGRRVELIYTDDPYTKLIPGDRGTYEYSMVTGDGRDRMVQHSIKWDSGSRLMLIGGRDSFKFVEENENESK